MIYQYLCSDCGSYGQGFDDQEQAQRDADMHQAEYGHTNVEVVEPGHHD